MRGPRAKALLAASAAVLAAGCGSAAGQAAAPVAPPAPTLATSLVNASGAWAVAELGGSAADHNNFWQLLVRPAAGGKWRLVTPPGMASNGGLVMAAPGGSDLTAGFRPSQKIHFSPLAVTGDSGAHWSTGLLDPGLADVPDAMASAPGSGRLIALLPGEVEVSPAGGNGWTPLVTQRTLSASAAGRRCGLTRLTAVGFSPSGTPLAAGSCAHSGTVGVFALAGGTWRAAGPALPTALAGQPVTVLRLTMAGTRETALLDAGAGPGAVLLAAWSGGTGGWTVSPALPLGAATARSASFGPGGEVGLVTGSGDGETLAGPGASWQRLPTLPQGTQTLALGTGQPVQALAAHRSTLTVWQLGRPGGRWSAAQRVRVPIQYGSSS